MQDEYSEVSNLIGLINKSLDKRQKIIAQDIIKEIKKVQFIIDVGLTYLSLNRSVATLSGGRHKE